MKYKTRADLLIAAGESIKMQEKAGVSRPLCRLEDNRPLCIEDAVFTSYPSMYTFPLAVVEKNPVFAGDKLFHKVTGEEYIVQEVEVLGGKSAFRTVHGPIFIDGDWIENYTLTKPTLKMVMIPMLEDDAKLLAGYHIKDIYRATPTGKRLYKACAEVIKNGN